MKKTLLAAWAFLCLSTIASAQITKGSVLLGGSIGISKFNMENETNQSGKSTTLNFNPTVGIAVKDNWVAGVIIGFTDYEDYPANNFSYMRHLERYSGGIFLRRYLALSKNFYLYGDGSISYQSMNHSEFNISRHGNYHTTKGVSFSITPGVTYAVNKRFHLEASLNNLLTTGYSTTKTENITQINGVFTNTNSRSKGFEFGTNFNTTAPLSIGFRFVLGK